jgi:drug/metabolite transporter (DMT)-like permease
MRLKADLTLLLVSIIWGTAFVAQRVAGQMGSVYLFNGVRYLLAAVVVLPFAIRSLCGIRRGIEIPASAQESPLKRTVTARADFSWLSGSEQGDSFPAFGVISRAQFKWMFVAGLLLFVGSALQQLGVVYTTAGNAGFITGLYVVLVPIVLFIGWRERLHWLSVVAVGLAVSGAFLLSTGARFEVRVGDALELVSALFWTFHVIVLGKFASRFESMSFSVGQLVVCGLLNLGVGAFVEKSLPLNWPLVGAIVYTAFFSLGLCYTLQIWAQRHTPPADAALILSLESVFAVLSGWLLLNEHLAVLQALGCALIFIAVILSQFKELNLRGKMKHPNLVEDR